MPKGNHVKLTDAKVKGIKPPRTGRKEIFDQEVSGLSLRITASGARSFSYEYRLHNKKPRFTWKVDEYSLEEARDLARKARGHLRDGKDPKIEFEIERVRERSQRDRPENFEKAVHKFIDTYQIAQKHRSTAEDMRRLLLKEGEAWLHRPVDTIGALEIDAHLRAIRDGRGKIRGRPYLANLFYANLKKFFSWCASVAGGQIIEVSPMLGVEKPFGGAKPRDVYFEDTDIGLLWNAAASIAKDSDSILDYNGAIFTKMLLLTGKRKGALSQMKWDEIDNKNWWTPASSLAANKRAHPIPLSKVSQKLLRALRTKNAKAGFGKNPFVFVGRDKDTHLDPGTWLKKKIVKSSGVEGFYFHALRHTVETKMAKLKIPPHIRDLALDHAPSRGSGKGYDHYDYAEELEAAFEKWAAHIDVCAGKNNVIPLPRSTGKLANG